MTSPSKERAAARKSRSAGEKFEARAESVAARATSPKKRITRKTGKTSRFYNVEGEDYASVTTILKVIGKPALINWAANEERKLCIETFAQLYESIAGRPDMPKMSRPGFINTVEKALGKERAHKKLLTKASDIGTQAHNLVEWNLRRQLGISTEPEPHVQDAAQWAFMACQDWMVAVDLKPLFIEQVVYHHQYHYAGTMDLLCELDGRELLKVLPPEQVDLMLVAKVEEKPRLCALVDFKTGKGIYAEAHLQNVAYQEALIAMDHGTPDIGLIVRLPKNEVDPAFEVALTPPREHLFPVFLATQTLWQWWQEEEAKGLAKWKKQKDAEKEAAKNANA